MELIGLSFIASQRGSRDGNSFQAFAPQTGDLLQPVFRSATPQELDRAAEMQREPPDHQQTVQEQTVRRQTGKQ